MTDWQEKLLGVADASKKTHLIFQNTSLHCNEVRLSLSLPHNHQGIQHLWMRWAGHSHANNNWELYQEWYPSQSRAKHRQCKEGWCDSHRCRCTPALSTSCPKLSLRGQPRSGLSWFDSGQWICMSCFSCSWYWRLCNLVFITLCLTYFSFWFCILCFTCVS